ncbi:hypothetical protein HPS54_11720 [Prevotella sp. PCHR]|uniref:HTH HARE-type domain-containing protein n=1 Tax=Xylanibacter caecicola TaxID=2736294 RepID=A0ABX2B6Z9_9BACT|nr:hypothetical protein [Xylanibacter caecicola]NPE26167.1 hypothetical protein [Xylanibacter caecicola]
MTKVEAIAKVMEDNGGTASLDIIYRNICKYYPDAKSSKEWEAGIRGVLYREIRNNRRFKKIGLSIYAISGYEEETRPRQSDKIRMHSYIEGICIELGNFNNYLTYTADPSAKYRDNLKLKDIATMDNIPSFSYNGIIQDAKHIDVIWFNKKGYRFPKRVFEVVDSIGTLNGAFNRSLQLKSFITDFIIVAPEKHRDKFNHTIEQDVYSLQKDRFTFINYDDIMDLYETTSKKNKIETKLFG